MITERYWEDLFAGQKFASGQITVNIQQMKAFASEFDPQPFHLDESMAERSFFGRLVASGWHTAALTMKLLVESELRVAGGLIGAGVDEVKWPHPVFPGETLHLVSEVLEVRSSNSLPNFGIVRVKIQTLNLEDLPVQTLIVNLLVPRRPLLSTE